MINGPNSCFGAGSLILVMEKQVDYAVEVAKKMQRERLKSIEPKLEAVKDFDDYIEAYFKTVRRELVPGVSFTWHIFLRLFLVKVVVLGTN